MTPHPLRIYRTRAGISGETLGRRLGVTKATVSRIETRALNPGPELAKVIEAETGVPKWQLRPDLWDKPRAART